MSSLKVERRLLIPEAEATSAKLRTISTPSSFTTVRTLVDESNLAERTPEYISNELLPVPTFMACVLVSKYIVPSS